MFIASPETGEVSSFYKMVGASAIINFYLQLSRKFVEVAHQNGALQVSVTRYMAFSTANEAALDKRSANPFFE